MSHNIKKNNTDSKNESENCKTKNKNESPSIKKLMQTSQKDSPIKKKGNSRVKKIVLELEKSTKSKSNSESSGNNRHRKNSVLQNQSKITHFFGKDQEQD